jgi:hypothetical protein
MTDRTADSSTTMNASSTEDEHSPVTEEKDPEWAPIRGTDMQSTRPKSNRDSRSSRPSSIRSLSRSRSHNGYGCDETDEPDEEALEGQSPKEKDPWEVGWEGGDADPMNPRSMSLIKKWAVVLIVSMSSLCVYELSPRG